MFDRFGNKIGHLHSLSSMDDLKATFICKSYPSLTFYWKNILMKSVQHTLQEFLSHFGTILVSNYY